jgi:hypothetical protein
LSNQSPLPVFFSCRKVYLKSPINSDLRQAGIAGSQKMALGRWFYQIIF